MADSPYYSDYLQLGRLLDCQQLESVRQGKPAHDEMLFIVVHQAFELWFKQILWELEPILDCLARDLLPDREISQVVARLQRITTIQRLLLDQIDVLETMTPLDFLDFRDMLIPASGLQSVQFRMIENRLGLRRRLKIRGQAYDRVMSPEHQEQLRRSEQEPSLFDAVERWLERTPFLAVGDFRFWDAYRAAAERLFGCERAIIESHQTLDDEARAAQLIHCDKVAQTFGALFDEERYRRLLVEGTHRLSQRSFLAALLINLYRDEPALQLPFRFLTELVHIDEGFTVWRYRHALLARRMIGAKIGTGGTSGHAYLEAAARTHRVFGDLLDLPTYFLPRTELPPLPAEIVDQMRFRYAGA
jgi:tryptophan 2,3-dioxygenase